MWRGAKKEVPKKTVVFLRHFYAEIIPRNPPSGQVVFIAQKTTVFFGNEYSTHRGDEMNTLRKIFMVVICAVLTANTAMAKWKEDIGYKEECLRYKDGASLKSVQYYFCGDDDQNSCRGKGWTRTMKPKKWVPKGTSVTTPLNDVYWCCGGDDSTYGKFKKGAKRYTSASKTIPVGGGTCTYTYNTDLCEENNDEGTPCTVPDTCPDGQIVRNEKCTAPCPSSQGYESATSNTCVSCTGDAQGVNSNGICVKCNSGQKWNGTRCEAPKEEICSSGQVWDSGTKACKDKPQEEESASEETESSDESGTETAQCQSPEYLSPKSGKCVSKSAAKQYSRDMFDSCYACPTDTRFKRCLDFFRNPPTKLKESDKKVLVSCNIDPAEYDSDAAGKSKFRLIDKLGKLGGKGKTSSVPAKGKPENSLQESAYRDNVGTAVDYEF